MDLRKGLGLIHMKCFYSMFCNLLASEGVVNVEHGPFCGASLEERDIRPNPSPLVVREP